MAYLLYANMLLTSIRRIVEFTEQFQRGMTGIERFYEIMDAPREIKDKPGAKALGQVRGAVTFDNVSFHYADDRAQRPQPHQPAPSAPGRSVALVGPSGSGKDHPVQPDSPLLRRERRTAAASTARTSRT